MDLRHLQTFKVIAEEGSFVQAAERLQYAQSTITLQIQQLEEELGVELFDRRRRKIKLTLAGQTLLTHAQHVLNQVEQMQQDLSDLIGGESGYLRVGMIEPVARLYLTHALRRFRAHYPRIRLTMEILSTIRTHEQLEANQIDLGISTPPPASSGFAFEPLLIDEMVLVLPREHPLQAQAAITLSHLQNECLMLTYPPCAYRTAIEQAFMAHGLPLTFNIEIGSLEVMKQAVAAGLGIAIVPQLAAQHIPAGTVIRSIADWNFHLPIGFITRAIPLPQGKALQAFKTFVKQAIAEGQPDPA
ncbi:LysR family transcriptional regulator [Ktedonosporobacter rubrisoli]|uniref:LysR family transcriptional regulator n=1 Tax=Ktedonosporobacter rubrisoli TaxID=2509675 RepID=A0A4P6JVT3_KTERU|nr:LysR family transcriptional regulator [Ktedonosporobacter rubrisoli]QBD79493.1 LysR family transcriptional regulator [Ktedonosporobacter rubrisoli]